MMGKLVLDSRCLITCLIGLIPLITTHMYDMIIDRWYLIKGGLIHCIFKICYVENLCFHLQVDGEKKIIGIAGWIIRNYWMFLVGLCCYIILDEWMWGVDSIFLIYMNGICVPSISLFLFLTAQNMVYVFKAQ